MFGECGVKLTLVGGMDDLSQMPKGLRAHPYITQEITVKVNDRDKHIGELDVNQIIGHFKIIFKNMLMRAVLLQQTTMHCDVHSQPDVWK